MRKAPGATTPALADKPSWHSIVEPSQPPLGGQGVVGFKSRRPDSVKGQLSWPFVLSAVNVLVGSRQLITPVRAYGLRIVADPSSC